MSTFKVAGMMSGSSLDGLDIALCEFTENEGRWVYRLQQGATISFPETLSERLKKAVGLSAEELSDLHFEFGAWAGKCCAELMARHEFNAKLVSSHGHTVFHQPVRGITLQIGDGQAIADQTRVETVYDFRSGDVALGGQGAPLVPLGDSLLFGEYRFCLNLGGIANISFEKNGRRIAGDICALNQVLNYLSSLDGLPFDPEGKIAASGEADPILLEKLRSLPYYAAHFPKSLGKEDIERDIIPLMKGRPADLLRTWVEHSSGVIAGTINTEGNEMDKVLVTGGGSWNSFFIECLRKKCKPGIHIPDEGTVNFKEALIFAFLGLLKKMGRTNVLSSVTGARSDSSSGILVSPGIKKGL